MQSNSLILLLLGIFILNWPALALGQSLNEVLLATYNNNLTLQTERHATTQAAENINLVQAGFFPTISAVGALNYQCTPSAVHYARTKALQIEIDQNLFAGFKTLNNIKAAKDRYLAQYANLCNEEQNQLNNAVAAYVNVYASKEIVRLRRDDLLALKEQVRTTKARLDVGEGTRTDYEQAKAAYSRAEAQYSESIAQNAAAEAVFTQISSLDPKLLKKPQIAKFQPKTLNKALQLALSSHPAILAADYNFKAAQANLLVSEGDFLPKVDLSMGSGYSKTDPPIKQQFANNEHATSLGVKMVWPLYAGGARVAQTYIAKQQVSQAQLQVALYRANVKAALISAWAKLKSSRIAVAGYLKSVAAAKIALAGREAEHKVGQATELDVLNTRSQLITMQVALIGARKDLVVASYNLRAALGTLTAEKLGLINSNARIIIVKKPVKAKYVVVHHLVSQTKIIKTPHVAHVVKTHG